MDFGFFDRLSEADARRFLRNFLDREKEGFASMEPELCSDGIDTRIQMDNVESVLRWILSRLRAIRREPDASLPSWIRSTSHCVNGLIDFDVPSKVLVLRAAYFLGQAFVECYPDLSWTIGNSESAVKNMPVVAGFRSSMEMSPIMVTENVYKRILADGAPVEDLSRMIQSWKGKVPVSR